ncbi:hypothetical protein [Staphylococcus cohnii]|uniref:hypothetical protein n=1 Tax=Staphylococcus cohnii TaxID=29382 RepID=UPI00368EBF0C
MATYKQLSDFFNEHEEILTSDETTTVNNFFDAYPDAEHFQSFINDVDVTDRVSGLSGADIERQYVKASKVSLANDIYDASGYLSGVDIERKYVKSKVTSLDDIQGVSRVSGYDVDDHSPIKANITDASPIKRTFTPLQSRAYPTKPTVRKRRKQWGGKANYRTYELNARKSMGYALRSMKRHLPKIDRFSIAKAKERMKRSISHTMFKADITIFETQRSRMELELFDAYQQFAYYLFEQEQEDTSAKKDAWVFAMPSGTLDDFIKDHYAPTIRAFAELPSEMKAFIEKEWNEYGERARVERQDAYGYNLTQEQVDNLQDADLSYMRELM